MFFESLAELENIAKNSGTVIFALRDGAIVGEETFNLTNFAKNLKAITIEPQDGFIGVDKMRELIAHSINKEQTERFFIILEAESLREEAENAILKLLEEPREHYHFILLSDNVGAILPTIRSRAALYAPKRKSPLEQPPVASGEVLAVARRLISAKTPEIAAIADFLGKQKPDKRREFALAVLSTAIELAYKSYFKTENAGFLAKVPGLLKAYDGIAKNGNLKLQFVANLV